MAGEYPMMREHPTTNIQRPTSSVGRGACRIGCSMLDVGCWLFRQLRRAVVPLVVLVLLMGATVHAQDQGSVSGVVVSSWDGTPLGGATVTVRGTTLGTQTDSSGRFQLDGVPMGEQVLRFSKSGYASAVVSDVRVLPGQTTTVNGNLRPEFYEMEEYEVTAELFTQQTEKIMFEQQSSSSMINALGSDFLSRVGAGNAAESISKVSGATIVDGKFAVIRGLNDRYVTVTLNGASIPSADPYRQSASLDLFPSQVIDKVTVAKTFTPDQPGTFTGGGIDIVTKSFPEKPFFNFSLGGAYNTQTTFNDNFLSYKGGGLDWLGMDDGTRALPDELLGQIPPAFPGPSSGTPTSPNFGNRTNAAIRLDLMTRALGTTQFAPTRDTAMPNHNFSMAGGGSTPVFDGVFGYFAGVNYKHDYSFYEDGISRRYDSGTRLKSNYRDARALSMVNWSTMVNFAYKPFDNHELGFTFFYNQNGTDDARIQDQGTDTYTEGATFRKFNLYWTERNLNTYQMRGEHHFPTLADLQFNWMVAFTQTTQDEPDARFFNDFDYGGGASTGNPAPNPSNPTRYFRNLDENNRNIKLDWAIPFKSWTGDDGKLKFGLFDSYSERTFTDRAFYYPGAPVPNNDPNLFLNENNLGLIGVRTNASGSYAYTWGDYIQVFDSRYDGDRTVQALYPMLELPVLSKVKLVGGVRLERTEMNVHSESYLPSSFSGLRNNTANLEQTDVLPGIGLIYSLTSNMNVRLNYGQTVARPNFREMAAYYSYDPTIDDYVEGNPTLRMSAIENYDFRWEWFPSPGDVVSVSLFYKSLVDAIERSDIKTDGSLITFMNSPEAKLYGIEFEARKNLGFLSQDLKPFSFGGNLSLIESETKLTDVDFANKQAFFPDLSATRPLYDQSPYILNLDFSYAHPRIGTTATVIFNVSGPRIVVTKLNAPDVYEQPAPSLDFVLSQRLGQHASVKFSAKNLLDPEFKRTYGKDGNLLYSSNKKGMTFGITLNYDF
jgi:outer membrane receptor protein involved in Fe transport